MARGLVMGYGVVIVIDDYFLPLYCLLMTHYHQGLLLSNISQLFGGHRFGPL